MRKPHALIVLALTAAALRLLPLGWLHPLNWDEIEFFRATKWVSQGLMPFRDFWEHHTPLQWFVFAPVAAFADSPGTAAVIAMRWAQLPVWIAAFWLANVYMRRAGLSAFARWSAVAIALCSSFFMLPAVEYRVDTLAVALCLAGLVLVQRMDEHRGYAFGAGVAFCLTGFANLRLGPLLAVTALLLRVVDPRQRAWRGNVRAHWLYAGVIATFAAALAFFAAAGMLEPLYRQVWVENYLGEKGAQEIVGQFLHRLLVPFGVRVMGAAQLFDPYGIDAGGIALLILGFCGLALALRRWRTPDDLFVIGFLQVVSLLFIAAMKFVFNYHFEIVVLMMLPLIALVVERIARKEIVVAIVAVAWLVHGFAAVFRGKELDRHYQDVIMREAHARTAPGDKVWDGIGWALHRRPAYRFWFLPELARQLVALGHAAPVRTAEFANDPPAAIVADHNALVWLSMQRDLQRYVARHYVPVWRNLWVPGLTARVEPGRRASWLVPADGDYRLFASSALAEHPWMRRPLFVGSYGEPPAKRFELVLDTPAPHPQLTWTIDGAPATLASVTRLRKGQRLAVTSTASEPLGLFLVRGSDRLLFRQPPPGVTLEAAGPRVTHVPTFASPPW